ncbi:MAG: Two component transcriptional regulator, winged helix family [candidate division WWE3 bacterium GW2011_GWF2_41_45]|uniref:Response regulatory domain-containing protein n=3 Tax=Katanobacteria TaxID=422282 RepID=A0A1F4W0W2_UNCKA|nr:MAG: Two component transcriptional regulator, winged helix family [candidate division WWE3 bacterium GW2011_GWC2_41_23]KKS08762.1 MAG: Two component transcriptional regulator, winged helix family [candidate division WWE3 bacterium GW2011_GWF2_41_45]KKS11791.1 MAG: Two component transcriptional regulator, winged helix family [candidate division WWE3 bacterium GW2011_GWF1_41_53]KKS19407.1 MAG: Two component transcriptional regulator, winged helix family [candidate division WWE3 bacterium GW2011
MEPETPKKILLVEDDMDLRTVYSTVLISAGYDVQIATDGVMGLDMIKNSDWDLLLLDIVLPRADGIGILKKISEEKLKKGKIVVLTNLNNDSIITAAFDYGTDGYLIKSEITPGKLVDEVEGFLV